MLSSDEKRALRQQQGLLYSSGQFPLVGNNSGPSRRARQRMSPVKILVTGLGVGLLALVGLVVLLTKAAHAQPYAAELGSQVGAAGAVSIEHHREGGDAQ